MVLSMNNCRQSYTFFLKRQRNTARKMLRKALPCPKQYINIVQNSIK